MFQVFVFQLLFFIFFYFLITKYKLSNFFIDDDYKKPQSFHYTPIPRVGGILILITFLIGFFYIKNDGQQDYLFLICFLIINFILGILDDCKIIKNPIIRFILFFIFNIILIVLYEVKINFFNFYILDQLNSFYYSSILISFFCIFFVINGSNLIDGFNGLLSIHILFILLIILAIVKVPELFFFKKIIYIFIFPLILFLTLNVPKAKIFLGDNGSYLLGSFLAIIMIITYNSLKNISPFFFAVLVFYVFFEIFFSVFRKIFQKKNPFYPDNEHLHMLLYNYLMVKIKKKNCNFLTSLIINCVYFLIIIPSFFFMESNLYCQIYFILCIVAYATAYIKLKNIKKENNENKRY